MVTGTVPVETLARLAGGGRGRRGAHLESRALLPIPWGRSRTVAGADAALIASGGMSPDRLPQPAWERFARRHWKGLIVAFVLLVTPSFGIPLIQRLEAVRTLKEADAGSLEAQFRAGEKYAKGPGVPQDDYEAFAWYLIAARRGHIVAQLRVADSYWDGRGVRTDKTEAFRWHMIVASRGHSSGMIAVSMMYHFGIGVAENQVEFVKWTWLVDQKADGVVFFGDDWVTAAFRVHWFKELDDAMIEEGKRRAADWKPVPWDRDRQPGDVIYDSPVALPASIYGEG